MTMTIKKKKYIYLTKWCNITENKFVKFYSWLINNINKDYPAEPPNAALKKKDDLICVAIRKDYYEKCKNEILKK